MSRLNLERINKIQRAPPLKAMQSLSGDCFRILRDDVILFELFKARRLRIRHLPR